MKLILNDDEPIFIQISKAIEDEILTDKTVAFLRS